MVKWLEQGLTRLWTTYKAAKMGGTVYTGGARLISSLFNYRYRMPLPLSSILSNLPLILNITMTCLLVETGCGEDWDNYEADWDTVTIALLL